MNDLADYEIRPLQEDGEFAVSRLSRPRGLPSRLMVSPVLDRPAPASLTKLEHAFTLRTDLDGSWAARPIELITFRGRLAMVVEDPGGECLEKLIGEAQTVSTLLALAIGMAKALRCFHARELIHRDIKPANFIVNRATGQAWLTGFGLTSRLPRHRPAPEPPEVIAGTFAYMAPEQTGRMNRSVDSRSDLYSLGVSLYEMFVGELPFAAGHPMEWVHCHIARPPMSPSLRRREIPGSLSAIILKLLAKAPEERYQTAAGVEVDLQRCLSALEAHGRIDSFLLGACDVPDRLLVPEKLYGREKEIELLFAAFDRVVGEGTAELVLLSGYSGVGKSSIVHELHKVLVPPRGLFAAGKFDQYKRNIPYATLAHAFRTLVRQVLAKSDAEVARFRESFAAALGPNVGLIVNLVPQLKLIVGEPPPLPDLPPQEAKHRFQRVLLSFIGVFARPEHPLALFLDDLQWLDIATLELIEQLISDPDVRYVLLIGAYRDNEVESGHPLTRTLQEVRKAGARVHQIVISPLELDAVAALTADALHCDADYSRSLSQLIHAKTSGNPFFAIQFITALAEENLVLFDPAAAAWKWDLARILTRGYTDNVVELMVAKLNRLPEATQNSLKQLACVGNSAETATLNLISGEPAEELHTALWEAVRLGLVSRSDNTYSFAHDRIQQAAYLLIPDEQRGDVHLRIGRVLLASMTEDQLADHLFDVANQLNRGATLLVEHDEKAKVAAVNLRAGRKAKASAAYASAREYFSVGMALLDENDWSSQYELAFNLWLERAECECVTGALDTAGQLIKQLLPRATSKIDEAAVYDLKVRLHSLKSEPHDAVATALTCLRRLGIDMAAHPTQEQVQAEYEMVWQILAGRSIESLIDLPLMTDPILQAAMQVLSEVSAQAYVVSTRLYCVVTCRMVTVSLQYGLSGPSAYAYANWGHLLSGAFHRYGDGYRFAKLAYDLVEKHGFIATKAKAYLSTAVVAGWTQPIVDALDFVRKSTRAAIETGDAVYACYSMFFRNALLLARNDPLDAVWRESETSLDFARRAKYADVADIIVGQQRFIATMQGRTATFSTFSDAQFDEARFEAQITGGRSPMTICYYWILKLKARFLSGNYTEALAAADNAKPVLAASDGQIQQLDYFYYTALTVSALFEAAGTDQQQAWRELLTGHREQLREWAENYPPTFADKHALVSAEIARLEGRDADAMRLYEQAIRSARDNGFVNNEALALETAARFYADRGVDRIARIYRGNARAGYQQWGANGKVRHLEAQYPYLADEQSAPEPTRTVLTSVEHLELSTVLKMSQAVQGETDLKTLVAAIMRLGLEHAGAERGLLILPYGDAYRIEAEAKSSNETVTVDLRQTTIDGDDLPQSILQYVLRTREPVVLQDASAPGEFAHDGYLSRHRARSVLCIPLLKQTSLAGIIYLENNLTSRAFTPGRIALLEVLASEAAISLENARLYHDLQARERESHLIVETIPGFVASLSPGGEIEFVNNGLIEYCGQGLEAMKQWGTNGTVHVDDQPHVAELFTRGITSGEPFDFDARIRRYDGIYRWFQVRGLPLRDMGGQIVRWYSLLVDIDDRKRAETELSALKDQLYKENLVLRDEVDRTSMFEEIVGTSPALQPVLARVARVAGTDATVLITGETGTGKELVARAVHRRSARASRAFVSVNCAAVPRELIASELFGHEKGAFTGATQRRLGRFELAHGGTIFLDEVGELPMETQVALLRVLQEREFERVGGSTSIRVDVRIVTATNRSLQGAIEAGTFRSDLFYRLNVFPIPVPPLRERADDIPLLVEYFIDRYARQTGKTIRHINKRTLDHLRTYPWPGNVRELQNVIERSMIVCDTEEFAVDESWISAGPAVEGALALSGTVAAHEKTLIEVALRACGGRVYGPAGAAARLGMPRSTLESKIRALRINKHRFRP